MDWQQIIALSIVALTAGIFLWSRFRSCGKSGGCPTQCGHCGTSNKPKSPSASIVYHSRKGERPTITIKQ